MIYLNKCCLFLRCLFDIYYVIHVLVVSSSFIISFHIFHFYGYDVRLRGTVINRDTIGPAGLFRIAEITRRAVLHEIILAICTVNNPLRLYE